MADIIEVSVLLTDIGDVGEMNTIYREEFGDGPYPARITSAESFPFFTRRTRNGWKSTSASGKLLRVMAIAELSKRQEEARRQEEEPRPRRRKSNILRRRRYPPQFFSVAYSISVANTKNGVRGGHEGGGDGAAGPPDGTRSRAVAVHTMRMLPPHARRKVDPM